MVKAELGIYTQEEMDTLIHLEDSVQTARLIKSAGKPEYDHIERAVIWRGFQHYLKAKEQGIQMEANDIMLAEGIPQEIPPYQKKKLRNIDRTYKLK